MMLSPPQRLLLVNISESGRAGEGKWERGEFSLFPASARFFPSVQSRCDCRRPLRRRK